MKKAFLIATFSGQAQRAVCEEHLQELAFLSDTYGLEVVKILPCNLRTITASTYLSEGKVNEVKELIDQTDADVIIFDEEISPAQQRNLEKAFGREVIDRTELIIGVFAQRAHTKEAQLQVELAQVRYQFPRLKRLWTHLDRQGTGGGSGSGGGYLRGEGEKQIEIDKRLLERQVKRLESQIAQVRLHRETQRTARERSDIPTFALIGYTNVGKSSLLNALTDAGVFVEDKLFATLDTTTRRFELPNQQSVLVIDTVGFIRKLPHLLVAAFKSTLEEAFNADILLHVVDLSHPLAWEQAKASMEVLKELNAEDKPIITILNKLDRLHDPSLITKLRLTYPKTVLVSAQTREGFDALFEMMSAELREQRRQLVLRIPQSEYHLVSQIKKNGGILEEQYEDNDVILKVELSAAEAARLEKYTERD